MNTSNVEQNETVAETPRLNLACVYCGGSLRIECEYEGRAYMAENTPVAIECNNSDCGAEWSPSGEILEMPQWVRWPDLYAKP